MSSDSETEEEQPSWQGVPATVVLINLYDPIQLNTSSVAYQATCDLMRNYMRTASNQLVGACLYGTQDSSSSPMGFEGIFEVFPLSVPSLDSFKNLQKVDISSYGQAKELKLSDVLWHCSQMFANCKKLLSTKTVLMLTRIDVPAVEADQKPTLKRVEELVESGIQIQIINISENTYHVDNFYENLLKVAHKGGEFKIPEPVWTPSEVTNLMYQHSNRHTAVARLTMEIGEGMSIGVGIFSLLKSQTKPKDVKVDIETNQIVANTTTYTKVTNNNDVEDDEPERPPQEVPLLKSELLHYQIFGEERIEFTDQEMKKLKNPFGPPMIKLLGFKPSSTLNKNKWFLKGCHFLYPSESAIEGSTIAFKALHAACTDMSVIAICVLSCRVNSRPCLVALSPCTKPFGLDIKCGFDIIYIPFTENVRPVPSNEEDIRGVEEAHKLLMNDIIDELRCDYKPDMFESPSLQSLFCAIEALALEKEIEEITDTTRPDVSKVMGLDAQLFYEIFGPFGAAASKRPTTTKSNGAGGKRSKTTDDVDESLLRTRISQGKVEKYTVPELKQILVETIGIKTALTGVKKADLVKLVIDNFSM
ncbi:X-ray repair cross-complementing protein 6 [Plutella xylostella]|uniref:X-ray repair cross-complementing protein 6 n=1 Tax=Plutella xylostella TaxID=51655 RepID=UPI002032AF3A|nr:X-ray repair cross-complementing protein 6 [Plutella xylostella]